MTDPSAPVYLDIQKQAFYGSGSPPQTIVEGADTWTLIGNSATSDPSFIGDGMIAVAYKDTTTNQIIVEYEQMGNSLQSTPGTAYDQGSTAAVNQYLGNLNSPTGIPAFTDALSFYDSIMAANTGATGYVGGLSWGGTLAEDVASQRSIGGATFGALPMDTAGLGSPGALTAYIDYGDPAPGAALPGSGAHTVGTPKYVGNPADAAIGAAISGQIIAALATENPIGISMGLTMLGLYTLYGLFFKHTLEAYQTAVKAVFDPLVFNLSGSGLAATTTIDNGTFFDNANTGFKELTAWAGSGSGILVNDPSGGAITNGSQMFSTATSLSGGGYAVDGFAALADLDSNHDGVINSSDTAWSNLRMWVDSNGNGVTDAGEIETLSTAGIASISLTTTNTNTTDANGNYHGKTASYSLVGGGTREVDDISYAVSPALTIPASTVTVSPTIAALPDAANYGTVTTLQQAMQIQANASDTTLETYVQDFVAATDDTTRNTLVDEIIYQWTGVEGVSSGARGIYIDARQLEAFEAFSGKPWVGGTGNSNPTASEAQVLTVIYQQLRSFVLAELEGQTDLQPLFNAVESTYNTTVVQYSNDSAYDFSGAESIILSDLSANRATGLVSLADFNQALHALGMDTDSGFATFRTDLVAQGTDVAATFLYGTPVVYGTAGNDVITAWAGNQTVIANQGGNDTLIGSGDNETFYGSGGADLFIGGVGNNEVFRGSNNENTAFGGNPAEGSDTFIAGQGTQSYFEGRAGQVTAYYAAGDGHLSILCEGDYLHDNILILDSSIARSAIGLSGRVLTDGVSGDQVTIVNMDTLEFADGTTINLQKTTGIIAATANSTLTGSRLHDDIYSYDPGIGHATLVDTGGNNEIWMGGTVTASNITLTPSGNDLLITDGVTGDQITDQNRGVQTIRFSDGTTMSVFAVGSTYTLSGGTTSTGTALNDTYSFASGTGTATISDPGGQNTLNFGSGITAASLTYTAAGNDLLITDGVAGDEVIVLGQLGGTPVVQTEHFSGGSTVDMSAGLVLNEVSGGTVVNGTPGNDTLLGNSGTQTLNGDGGNDVFVAGAGTTTINGGIGTDIYSFASGSGKVIINDNGAGNSIKLGSGITTGNVSLASSGNDLLIMDGVAGDTITITGQLNADVAMDWLVFTTGGTTETLEGIALSAPSGTSTLNGTAGADTLTATTGTQTLIGNAGDDTFIGASGTESLMGNGWNSNNTFIIGTGPTTAYGSAGSDLYSYASGDGLLTINEEGGQNTLKLAAGLTAASLAFTASGHDLLITDGTGGDTITLKNQLTANQQVQTILFSDASTENLEGIALTMPGGTSLLYGTSGNDTLTATSGTETINGNGGNDIFIDAGGTLTAIGGTGNDTYSYAKNSGVLIINDSAGTNTLVLGTGITTGNVSLAASGHDLLILDGTGGDTVTLKNQLSNQYGITSMVFTTGGTTQNLESVNFTLGAGTAILYGTPGNDTLTASSGTQSLTGNGGNDTFVGTGGVVTMTGGGGNDSFIGGSGSQRMIGGGGNDTFQNAGGIDTMTGGTGTDTFIGGSGTETMTGGGGNDIFIAGSGSTALASALGNTGNDLYSYAAGDGHLTINEGNHGGTDTLKLASGLTSANVSLTETNGSDLLILDGTGGDLITIVNQVGGSAGNSVETLVYGDASSITLVNGIKVTATSGTATVTGTAGNDTLIATSGTQTLSGGGGSDTFIGSTGTQTLNANSGAGNNIFIAGVGATSAVGRTGNDTYSYAASDGTLVISDIGGTDTLKLASGLTSANVAFSESTNGHDLLITDGTGGDLITISSDISTSGDRVETLIYGDNSTLTMANGLTLTAQTGSSTLVGYAGNNTLIAVSGANTETLQGSTGNDIYSYASGTGKVYITDAGGTDTLKLGTGLTSANVVYTESSNGQDLVVTDGVGGDTITLHNDIRGSGLVETIRYGDGTTADLSSIVLTAAAGNTTLNGTSGNNILAGSTGNQTINGNNGNDFFNGGTGTQTLNGGTGADVFFDAIGSTSANGGTGNDTYNFASGDGTLRITEGGGTETLILGSGLTSSNVVFSEDTSGADLWITDGTSGDKITIVTQISTANARIETLIYGDASTLNLAGGLTLVAQTGNSTLIGLAGANTMIAVAGSGTETLKGSTGNDTYSYDSGTGAIEIIEATNGGTDTLKLGTGLTSSNVSLTESSNGFDMLILDGTGGDLITMYQQTDTVTSNHVETLVYGDATSISLIGINVTAASGTSTLNGTTGNDTLNGTTGNQYLYGDSGNDTFIGGIGTQTLAGGTGADVLIAGVGTTSANGGTGNDTYSYASGDGAMIITEGGGTDTLKLASGLNASNVFFSESSNGADLIITDGTSGDQITVKTAITTAGYKVETLVYGDSSTLDLTKVIGAGSSATTLNGTTGNDIMIPNTGNLTLAGKGGNDLYDFGSGMGHDYINNGVSTTNSANGTLFFGHGMGDDQLWFDRVNDSGTISSSGNNLRIISMGSTSSMTVNGWYIGGSSTYKQLSEFELSDNGLKLDSQLSNLVSAMATFETNYAAAHGGTQFDPTSVSSITDTTVLAAVNSDWA
jgi:Ca2+-binding RTX toxin-like protein